MLHKLKHVPSYIRRTPEKLKLAYWCLTEPYFKWVPPGHYYSPLPDMKEVAGRADKIFGPPPDSIPGIDLRPEQQKELLSSFKRFRADAPFERKVNARARFSYPNGSFPYQDAFVLSGMIRWLAPGRIIEVGCGASSCVILDTCEAFVPGAKICFIEPYPELLKELARPGDLQSAELRQNYIQDVPLELFAGLREKDILFIDTSHVSKVGSDVNHIFFQIFPVLQPGVVVHVHDIWYPFEYPRDWFGKGMFWNEAYLMRAFLMNNPRFEILLFNSYLHHVLKEQITVDFPGFADQWGASLWLRRK
jgi:hypothetical protein